MSLCRLLYLLMLLCTLPLAADAGTAPDSPEMARHAAGESEVQLFFFWSSRCPHCLEAKPFVEALPARFPWLKLHSHEVLDHPDNAKLYLEMAGKLGQDASSVPAFLFCGEMLVGFESAASTGAQLEQRLQACHAGSKPEAGALSLPLLGRVEAGKVSLPLITLAIAGLDAFNPCAFFVLLFLLSLMIREKSRARMLAIGGVFVLFSGLIYFVFMAAWLNVFLMLGEIRAVTALAGAVAVAMGLVNIKDFFRLHQGITLSIPESAKPGLFKRMRGLLGAASWSGLLFGTATLAVAANSYELLCTAGFPMVYTRLLTLQHLDRWAYYLYLALYNLVYVIPLLAIVLAFTYTLGSRKLSEQEGRLLKLMSGMMMLGLGVLLLAAPQLLNHLGMALGLLALALGVTWLAKKAGLQ